MLKGNSSHLMKPGSKRRRSKAQIADEKKAAEQKEQEIAAKLAQFDYMQAKMAEMQQSLDNANVMHARVLEMAALGELKEAPNGSFQVVDDMAERQSIRSAHASKNKNQQEEAPVDNRRQARDFSDSALLDADIDLGLE